MFLCLRERECEFSRNEGFVPKIVNVKYMFEDCDVMLFMSMCDLGGWNYYDVNFNGDVLLYMVGLKWLNEVLFVENELSYDSVE